MRKINIPPQKLKRIIELREKDASWSRIERETQVPRRTAKRAYEQSAKDQLREDAKKARSIIVAEEVRSHIDDLVELAQFIADHLEIPSYVEMEKGPSAYLDDLIRNRPVFIRTIQYGVTIPEGVSETYLGVSANKSARRIYRENKMLFEALETHTRQGARWRAINEWEHAWDECKEILNNLRNEALQIIKNILNQKKDIKQKIEAEDGEGSVIDKMVQLVLEATWQGIINEQLDQGIHPIETVPETGSVKLGDALVIKLSDEALAEEVARACNWSVDNLYKGYTLSLIPRLTEKAELLKKSIDRVEEDFNRLALRPILLGTRCKLCL